MIKLRQLSPRLLLLLGSLAMGTGAFAEDAQFIGRDGNWFSPSNWSTGRVPARGDDVEIGTGKAVFIDPAHGRGPVVIRDLYVLKGGSLETLPGTRFGTRNEIILGRLIHRGTDATLGADGGIGIYVGDDNDPEQGWRLNPTAKSKRIIDLQSGLTVGIGGTEAAGPGRTGQGFYANVSATTVMVAGTLDVSFHYGFTPRAGDRFTIVRARRIVGQFRDLPEGALVKRVGNIGLYIHYTTREHILLARPVGS